MILLCGAIMVGPLHAELVGWWQFDEDLNDASDSGLEGTEIGQPEFASDVPDALGTGKSLRVVSDGVRIDADAAIEPDVFSLGYFVNLDGAVQGAAGLQRLTSRQGDGFETAVGDANALGGTASPSGITLSYFQGGWNVTDVEIPESGWVHVVWKNTAEEMQLFVDGELEYTGPPVDPGRAVGFMNIGIRHNEVEGYEGLIDDVFLWDDAEGALADEDIQTIAANGMSGFLGDANKDSDGDGLPDDWEEEHGLDPEDDGSTDPLNGPEGDGDGDGLNNLQEFEGRTNPTKDDTDDDGLKDGVETNTGTWVSVTDTGTNPTRSDTDQDGLSDGVETNTGTFVSATDTGTDPHQKNTDGTAGDDGTEVANGTDPTDPADPEVQEDLVLHLPFDGNLDDASGQSNQVDVLGDDPVFENDVSDVLGDGSSISFNSDGTEDQGILVEGTDELAPDDFTMMYWIKPAEFQGNAGLERLTSRGGDQFETAIGDANAVGGGDGDLTLSYYQGSWNVTIATVDAEWTHVAWRNSVDDDLMEVFVDGMMVADGPAVPSGRVQPSSVLHIGTRHNQVEGYEGLLDDFRFYATKLSDERILELATASGGGDGSFQIIEVDRANDLSTATITWESRPGASYILEHSADLQNWTELNDSVPSGGETTTSEDPTANAEVGVRYYRVAEN